MSSANETNETTSQSSSTPFFSLRAVSLDWIMVKPVPGLDICWSPFEGRECREVPLVRIFGSTPSGQKCCLNLHKGFPYFFLNLPTTITTKAEIHSFIHKLGASIDRAVDISLGRHRGGGQYVFGVEVVRGRPFYGYSGSESLFLKVLVYNPEIISKMVSLLGSGVICQTKFQAFEAHIPFLLQLFVDNNLVGMDYIRMSEVSFREPLPPPERLVKWRSTTYNLVENTDFSVDFSVDGVSDFGAAKDPTETIWSTETVPTKMLSPLKKQAHCVLEVDASVDDILNSVDRPSTPSPSNVDPAVTTLCYIWEDERKRRFGRGNNMSIAQPVSNSEESPQKVPTPLTPNSSSHPRVWNPNGTPSEVTQFMNQKLKAIIDYEDRVLRAQDSPSQDAPLPTQVQDFPSSMHPVHQAVAEFHSSQWTEGPKPEEVDEELLALATQDREAYEILEWMQNLSPTKPKPPPSPENINKKAQKNSKRN